MDINDKNLSIHHTAVKICEDFLKSTTHQHIYEDVQKLVSTPNVKLNNFQKTLINEMEINGIESNIKNIIYYWIKSHKKNMMITTNEQFFRKSQILWDKRIHKSLNSMCNEFGVTLAKSRTAMEKEQMLKKWNELSQFHVDLHKYRPIYAPRDFLEILLNLNGPKSQKNKQMKWEFSQIPIPMKTMEELRNFYQELSRGEHIIDINSDKKQMEFEREKIGKKILEKNYAPLAQEFIKKGCPPGLRAKLWLLILGVDIKQNHINYFQSLKMDVINLDLMIDKLLIKDIILTAINDDQYFVYEDLLLEILLCFSRDYELFKQIPNQYGFMQVFMNGGNTIVFPPNGVIPFHGFAMYAAPFCYLYDDHIELYYVFREFYLKYWQKLHRINGYFDGILGLCVKFEKMLQCFEPLLWKHFRQYHIHPIRIVIKWMMRGFSGHLAIDQLLNLWDLILAYDSMEIIPLLAVVILIFRKENLLKVTTMANIEAVLSDLSSICVIPLLEIALMKDGIGI